MKQCPICGSKFSGAEVFCPHDGARLLEAEQPAQLLGQTLHDIVKLESLLYKDALGERYAGRLMDNTSVKVTVFNQAFSPDPDRVSSLVTTKTLLDEPLPVAIAPTHAWEVSAEDPGYLLEGLAPGPSLRVLLDERGKLDWRTAIKLTCSIARVLEWMDNQGVTHRLLQPDTISITNIKKGTVHLGEWALGALSYQDNPLQAIEKGQIFGGAEYIAPELIDGGAKADRRSLIYALGLLLYEMLTGKSPYRAQNTSEVLKPQRREKPVKLSISYEGEALPAALDDLLEVMIAKQPEQRLQSLGALVNALSSLLDDDTNASDFPELERDPSNVTISVPKKATPSSKEPSKGAKPSINEEDKERKRTLLFISADEIKKAREEELKETSPTSQPSDDAPQPADEPPAPEDVVEDSEKPTIQMNSDVLKQDLKSPSSLSTTEEENQDDEKPAAEETSSEEKSTEESKSAPDATPPVTKKKKKKKKNKDTIRLGVADLPSSSNNVSIDDPESDPEEEEPEVESASPSTIVISKDFSSEVKEKLDEEKKQQSNKAAKGETLSKTSSKKEVEAPSTSIIIDDSLTAESPKEDKKEAPSSKKAKKEETSKKKREDAEESPSLPSVTTEPAPVASTSSSAAEVPEEDWFNSDSEKAWDNEIFMEHTERTDKKFKTYLIVALVLFLLALIVGAIIIATAPKDEEEASLISPDTPELRLATHHLTSASPRS